MIGIMKFIRKHPMGLVLATSILLLGGLVATAIFYPLWVDARLIEQLDSSDSFVRQQAIQDASRRVKIRDAMKDQLLAALDTTSDKQFFSIVSALRFAGVKLKNQLHIDRTTTIEFATAPDPKTKVWLLAEIVNERRDNRYTRQALKVAAGSEHVSVRIGAALLAAMLKDDAILGQLLGDDDKVVRGAAALDAGLAGRTELAATLEKLLGDDDPTVAGNAAAGLAHMDSDKHAPQLCELLITTSDEILRQRLCHVMTILNNDAARQAMGKLLSGSNEKQTLSPIAILAGGKLNADGAADRIREILDTAVKERKTDRNLVHAAIDAAGMLNIPADDQLYKICRKYWNPDVGAEMMFISAARLLGRQNPKTSNPKEVQQLLMGAAYYAHRQPTTGPAKPVETTPVASAAAATAVWLLNPSSDPTMKLEHVRSEPGIIEFTGQRLTAARVVLDAAEASILAGDYIAWHIGHSSRPEAFGLGLRMLPPIGAPLDRRIYNENARGAGAMLLAFAAKSDEQKKIAIQRISERLNPGDTHSGEDDPILAGRYRCALLILGQADIVEVVRDQRNNSGHAVPAAMTALILAGDPETMDYLMYNTQIPLNDIAAYVVYDGLGRVLATVGPKLPTIDTSARVAIQLWQARIMRDYYMIHRSALGLGPQQ
jgi:hypothetical protein